MDMQPLQGVRILDLSRILAGPWCSQHLADLGAEVIKVEHPVRGDDTRGWGPPFFRDTGQAAYYLGANRGKQSIAIDIATSAGQSLVRELVQECDVLLENFKVGALAKYGLDYASLKALKPDLVYCSITGFGQDGPYAGRAGYDFLLQGMGGLMSITGHPDTRLGCGPVKVGVAVTDLFTGMYASSAILAALWQRERQGKGAHIDLSLLDVQVAMLANQAMNYLVSGDAPGRLGNAHPNIVPYEAFPCADGHLILAVGNDDQFVRFCRVADADYLAEDPRFSTNRERVHHREELLPVLRELLLQRSRDEWLSALEQAGVPCGPINHIDQVFEDPQVRHRGMRRTQAANPDLPLLGNPTRIDGQPMFASRPPPALGEHTDVILDQVLGYDRRRIEQLRKENIIR